MKKEMTFQTRLATARIASILEALVQSPGITSVDLAAKTHMCKRMANRYLAHLTEGPTRRVRIVGWQPKDGAGGWAPQYSVGTEPDVARPKRLTREEINRRYWSRLKKDKERYQQRLDRDRILHQINRVPPMDPVMAHFYGRSPSQLAA